MKTLCQIFMLSFLTLVCYAQNEEKSMNKTTTKVCVVDPGMPSFPYGNEKLILFIVYFRPFAKTDNA